MANVTVYNMEGNEVGTIELSDAVFGVTPNEHLLHITEGQDTFRSFRQHKKALETEGNRPCKTGLNKSSAVDTRRRCVRTCTERLFLQAEQEGKESGSFIRSERQRCDRKAHRC